MSSGTKRLLDYARQEAIEFRDLFAGRFSRWEIAGSVRRRKPEVGDIEHVVMGDIWSRLEELTQDAAALFGATDAPLTKAVYENGTHRWGDRYRGVMFRGFKHEIFMADADNFGAILAIRTGPAEFSQRLVTNLKARGLYRQQGGYVVHVRSGDRVSVATEESFFVLCCEPFVDPHLRK